MKTENTKYKDSGIPWIGLIPEDWSVAPFKHFVTIRSGECISKEEYVANGDIPVVGSNGEIGRYNKANNSSEVITTGRVGTVGTVHLVSKAWITDNALILEIYGVAIKYAYYLIPNFDFNMMLSGTAQPLITATKLKNQTIILPPLPTQQRIADFLDRKCAEIDELAALQETMIDELKRYKQSVITEAVTKGLAPDVPMKDSGVEWIGEIPEGWEETKVLNLLAMPITDGPHETPNLFDSGIPFISADAVSDGYINFDNKRGYISQEYYEECCKKYIPQMYDIYMIKSGASTGRTAIVETNEIFTIWSPLAVFRANAKIILPYFLLYVLRSYGFQKQVETNWSYGTQQNIGMRTLEKLIVSFPPLSEQQAIADYLDEKCNEIDELIAIKQQKIEQLKEYKKSVIFEYVTGKKEI